MKLFTKKNLLRSTLIPLFFVLALGSLLERCDPCDLPWNDCPPSETEMEY